MPSPIKSKAHFAPRCGHAGFYKRTSSQVLDLRKTGTQTGNLQAARGCFGKVLEEACCGSCFCEAGEASLQGANKLHYSSAGKQRACQQRAAYSGRSSKRQKTGVRSLKELLDWSPAASNSDAASWLLKQGVVKKARHCSSCGGRAVQGPFELCRKGRKPHWHWRCSNWKCQKRHSFLQDSTFCDLQAQFSNITVYQSCYLLLACKAFILSLSFFCFRKRAPLGYPRCSSRKFVAVRPEHLAQACHRSYKQCIHFVDAVLQKEAAQGRRVCNTAQLSKNAEVDATSVGKWWIPASHPLHQDQIQALPKCKSYPVHWRILGMRQRHNGLIVVKFLRPLEPRTKSCP